MVGKLRVRVWCVVGEWVNGFELFCEQFIFQVVLQLV